MSRKANKKYIEIRKGLISQGTNLRKWALTHGHPVSTVYSAARGERAGIEAMKIVRELEALAA